MQKLNVCGREIIRLRTAADISQETLAARCQLKGWDVSRNIIANIELGRRFLRDSELAVLSEVLSAPLEEFFPKVHPKAFGMTLPLDLDFRL